MDEGMHSEGMHADAGQLHLGPEDLPPGMELNEGDIVEFKVTGPKDSDGHWPIEYNYGEGGKGGEGMEEGGEGGEGTSWEDDFRKSMSPRSDDNMGGNTGGGGY